ncbi:MAG: ABC transporter substrate-binding protein, partial [Burkholderiaceae bacterium]
MSHFSRRDFNRIAAGAAGVAALGTPAFLQAQTRKIKVGVILPRSGYLAKLGQSCQMGADISPALIKQMYGVEIELMNADFESKVEEARARAEKLVDDGAQVLMGAFDSGASSAIAQVAEQRKVPFVVNVAAAPQITKQGYKYTFRNFPTAPQLVTNGLALFRDLFQAT